MKQFKRCLSGFLCLALLLAILPREAIAVEAQLGEDGETVTTTTSGADQEEEVITPEEEEVTTPEEEGVTTPDEEAVTTPEEEEVTIPEEEEVTTPEEETVTTPEEEEVTTPEEEEVTTPEEEAVTTPDEEAVTTPEEETVTTPEEETVTTPEKEEVTTPEEEEVTTPEEEEEVTLFGRLFTPDVATALEPAMNESYTLGLDNSIALTGLTMPMNEVLSTVADATETNIAYGSFAIELPSGTEATYTVKITLSRTSQGDNFISLDNTESYLVTATYADGSAEEKAVALNPAGWPNLAGQLSGLAAGTTVLVKDILAVTGAGDTWGDYTATYIYLEIVSSDASEGVELITATQTLDPGGTISFVVDGEAGPAQNITTEIFETQGGTYDLLYMLNNYNVVSLKDIEATHIVGAIIAQEGAYRTGDAYTGANHDGSDLVASDYSRGVSSYVGKLYNIEGDINTSALQLGYGFDDDDPDFIPPDFYTRATEIDGSGFIGVSNVVENWTTTQYVHLSRTGGTFLSPNAHGIVDNYDQWGVLQEQKTNTYQNDNFIDFDRMWSALTADSYALLEEGSLEGPTDVTVINGAGTYLEIEAGKSYLIKDATELETVNIILPEGYDFFVNPYLPPTTINFSGTTINPEIYDGLLVSQFPETFVDGVALETMDGENGEYSEVGNKIIWNLPNVVTTGTYNRLVTFGEGVNIAGHIVAVNAEFWNINSAGAWEGGNLNGTAIVQDFHSGNMEMHMWAYGGLLEQATYVSLEVEKIFTKGDLSSESFMFKLTGDDGTELYATTNSSGMAYFSALVFDTPGTYTYSVEEVLPADYDPDNPGAITYDLSTYTVEITVTMTNEVDSSGYTYNIYASTVRYTKDEATEASLTFTNIKSPLEEGQSTSYTFTKVDEAGYALSGAVFIMLSTTDPETAGDGAWDAPLDIQTSDGTGAVTLWSLEPGVTYYFKESVAPNGYTLPTGYWKLDVDEYGVVTVTPMDGAATMVNNQVVNYRTDTDLANVLLTKENQHGRALEGAVFQIDRVVYSETLTAYIVVEGGYTATATTGDDGTLYFTGLPLDQIYRISELVAPEGYMLPYDVDYWILEIVTDTTVEIGYTVHLSAAEETWDEYGTKTIALTPISDLILINMDMYILPTTGGTGVTRYYVWGLLLLCGAGLICSPKIKKGRRER